jgi:hypothetical protein
MSLSYLEVWLVAGGWCSTHLVHNVNVQVAVRVVSRRPLQIVPAAFLSRRGNHTLQATCSLLVPHGLCAVGHYGSVHAPVQPQPRRDEAVGPGLRQPCGTRH